MTVRQRSGRHFLQIPGPTNVPDRILRAMDMPTMDHRSPEFGALGRRVLDGMKTIFKCSGPVFIYPASGTGAWEAALVNTLSPGDHVLMYETGHFAALWKAMVVRSISLLATNPSPFFPAINRRLPRSRLLMSQLLRPISSAVSGLDM